MLNRRILRIKAMQALYGYFTTKESLVNVVRDDLEKTFTPDPLTHDMSDTEEIDAHRKKALRLYDNNLPQKKLEQDESIPEVVFDEVSSAIDSYYSQVKSEGIRIRKAMIQETLDLQDQYYKLLLLPGEFQFIEKQDRDKRDQSRVPQNDPWQFNLQDNPVIEAINTHPELLKVATKKKLSWQEHHGELKRWYKEVFKTNENFIAYQQNTSPSIEDHKTILSYLFKKVIFKHEVIEDFFAQEDLNWNENSNVLKSMVGKTFQDYDPEVEDSIQLKFISVNQEDDFEFFESIFDAAIREDEYLEGLIAQKTKNWDVSRLAKTDIIILKLAIAEMMTCRSIPVKVTINEFIDICKQYSTPKSKQFVNGILDVLANQLTSEGVIKKSGRGLIDNK